jgi:SAM-dependent methyltransferase
MSGQVVDSSPLQISESMIRRAAHLNGQGYNLPLIAARQAVAEAWVRTVRKAGFRRPQNAQALRGYLAMSAHEFNGVNARQRWANWRIIPRNLHDTCPTRPLMAIDLCCGTGDSTAVLAWHLPAGSRIHGLEFQPAFVDTARLRRYVDAAGRPVAVSFHAQSVLETFRDEQGVALAGRSVDVVNSCGAVGCHFTADATVLLAREVARVLAEDGVALIDAGKPGTDAAALERIFVGLGLRRQRTVRSCWLDRYRQLAFVRHKAAG